MQTDEDAAVDCSKPIALETDNGRLAYVIGRYVQINLCFEMVVHSLSVPLTQDIEARQHSIGQAKRRVMEELKTQIWETRWWNERGLPPLSGLTSDEMEGMYKILELCVRNRNIFAHAYFDYEGNLYGKVSQAEHAESVRLDVQWFVEAADIARKAARWLNCQMPKFHQRSLFDLL